MWNITMHTQTFCFVNYSNDKIRVAYNVKFGTRQERFARRTENSYKIH